MITRREQSFSALLPGNNIDENGDKDRFFVSALARGLEVLRCFTPERRELGKQEIARYTGLPKATVFRLIHTLTKTGYLTHSEETGKHRLDTGVLSLSASYLHNMTTLKVAHHSMQELADQTHSAVHLAIRDRLSIVLLKACKCPDTTFTLNLEPGSHIPLTQTGMGKALLCALPGDERNQLMDQIRCQDESSWPETNERIEQALKDYARWGFCLSIGDWRQDINSVGVAIGPVSNAGLLTLNCSGPAFQLRRHMLEDDLGPRLVHVARNIEAELARN
jgi:DNA-binding IclR family transcriptional regulator